MIVKTMVGKIVKKEKDKMKRVSIVMNIILTGILFILTLYIVNEYNKMQTYLFNVNRRGVTITKYLKEDKEEIIVPHYILGKPVYSLEGTFCTTSGGGARLKKIILPEGIKDIGITTFSSCISLEEMNIPEGVTILEESSFMRCSNLEKVELPSTLKIIEKSTFFECYKLKTINLPSSLEIIGEEAFERCRSLKEIIIPEGVKEIEKNTFRECENLEKVKIPASVEKIGENAFLDSEKVEIITPKNSYAEKYAKENNIPYQNE